MVNKVWGGTQWNIGIMKSSSGGWWVGWGEWGGLDVFWVGGFVSHPFWNPTN